MSETRARQRQAGAGHPAEIGVTKQRKNGMVVRRGGEFYQSALRRRSIRRKDRGQDLARLGEDKLLIFRVIPLTFRDECLNLSIGVFTLDEEFIEPCNLRKHLQVSKVLC